MTLLLCLLLAQDPVDDLLRRLTGDDIEARDSAQRELVELARKDAALRRRLADEAARAKTDEVRGRLSAALVSVEWTSTGEVPCEARSYWYSLCDGKRFIAWGGNGRTDGALFDGTSWMKLPAVEIVGRALPVMILSGDRLVVWSGTTGGAYVKDGACYDLKKLTVTKIPDAPIEGRFRPAVVDIGGRILFWGGAIDLNAALQAERPVQIMWRKPVYPADGAILDLESLTWKKIADAPVKARDSAWTGREFVVAGGVAERTMMDETWPKDAATYDPAKDEWTALPDTPFTGRLHSTDQGVLLWGPQGGALLENREWKKLPVAPVKALFRGVKQGRLLLYGEGKPVGAIYDFKTAAWTELPKSPLVDRVYNVVHWDGESLLDWGGWTSSDKPRVHYKDGASWKLGAKEWTRTAEAPLDVDGRYSIRSTATSRWLLAWGGVTMGSGKGSEKVVPQKPFTDAAMFDREAGTWRLVPCAGPLMPWMSGPSFFWLGDRLLIVDGDLARAAIWSPPR